MCKIAICSFPKGNRSRRSSKKSDRAKSDWSDSLLGIKWGKALKKCQKHSENNTYLSILLAFWECKCHLLSKNKGITHVSLCSRAIHFPHFCKEWQEWFTHVHPVLKSDKINCLWLLFKAGLPEPPGDVFLAGAWSFFWSGSCSYSYSKSVLQILILMDPHLKRPPRSGSAWRDADPDPGGKKSLENVQVH